MKWRHWRILAAGLICLAASAGHQAGAQSAFGTATPKGMDPKALEDSTPNATGTLNLRDRNNPDVIIATTTDALKAGRLDRGRQALALAARAGAYLQKMQYDMAIADFDGALEIDPKLADAYNGRGAAHQFQGKYDLAVDDYTHAIMLDPRLGSW
jgi:tetratricopeptide (TPR) repeat protein